MVEEHLWRGVRVMVWDEDLSFQFWLWWKLLSIFYQLYLVVIVFDAVGARTLSRVLVCIDSPLSPIVRRHQCEQTQRGKRGQPKNVQYPVTNENDKRIIFILTDYQS